MTRHTMIVRRSALPLATTLALFVPPSGSVNADLTRVDQARPAQTLPAEPLPESPRFYHVYEGRRRPLELDTARYAVLSDDAAARSLDVQSTLPIPGWRLARTSDTAIETAIRDVTRAAERADLEFVSPVFVGADGGPIIVTPMLLIRIDPAIAPEEAERLIAEHVDGEIIERDWANMPGAYRVEASTRSGFAVLDAANTLAETPGVLWAEPDMIFTGRGGLIPDDPFFSSIWGLHNTGQSGGQVDFDMDCPEAWDITLGDPSIIVVVLDTGVDPTHPDINQITGEDFTSDPDLNGAPVNVCESHGTAVAGCVSGIINNGLGGVGVAPESVVASARPFIATQPCDGTWSSSASWTVNALAWAESIGARVSNNSNGYGFFSSAIASKYNSTRNNGMVHFASAGNDSSASITYPSSLSSVNSVLALNRFGNRSGFSNWGVGSDFSAPGESILTTDRQGSLGYVSGDYVIVNGTSFAAPYTAGVAALVLAVDPSLTASEVELALLNGATDLDTAGYDLNSGWGLVNARASVERTPGGFEITSPACSGGFETQTFQWDASLFADSYTLEIASDAAFTSVIYSQPGITEAQHTVPPGAIPACATNYVRITAFNSFGQTTATTDPCPFFISLTSDINVDGQVNTADLGGLIGSFGSAGPFADINGDGIVDTADLGTLISDFGQNCVIK